MATTKQELKNLMENLDFLKQQIQNNYLLLKELKQEVTTKIELETVEKQLETKLLKKLITLEGELKEVKDSNNALKKALEEKLGQQIVVAKPIFKTWVYK